MKKHLQYLWAALFAVAALPAVAQTEANPLLLVDGENTVPETSDFQAFYKYTAAENVTIYLDFNISSYYNYRPYVLNDEGQKEYLPQANNSYPDYTVFNLAKGETCYFCDNRGAESFNCTITPIKGGVYGTTCDDAVLIPDSGEFFYPVTSEGAYAKYVAPKSGRFSMYAEGYGTFQTLYVGTSCDNITDYIEKEYSDNKYKYEYLVEEGETYYFKGAGWNALYLTCEVNEVVEGGSCKDAWTIEAGENVIPAADGEYWYSITSPVGKESVPVMSSNSDVAVEVCTGCGYTGLLYETPNFRYGIVQPKSVLLIHITKLEATASPETFNIEFDDLLPYEDEKVGEPIVLGSEMTTPKDASGYLWYSLTVPAGDPKLCVVTSNSTNTSDWTPTFTVIPEGGNSWDAAGKGNDNFQFQVNPGVKYMFRLNVYAGQPITFEVNLKDLEAGVLPTYPIEAKLGNNELPAMSTVYYTYKSSELQKIEVTSDIEGTKFEINFVGDSWTTVETTKVEGGFTFEPNPDKAYLLTVMKPNGDAELTGNLILKELQFAEGEAWTTAIEVEAGTYDLPETPFNVWYKLTASQTGFLTIDTNVPYDWSNTADVYVGAVDGGQPVEMEGDYSTDLYKPFKTGVAEGAEVYVHLKNSAVQGDEPYTITFGFMEAAPGETYGTAIPVECTKGKVTDLEVSGKLEYRINKVWYTADLPAGILNITSDNTFTVNVYSADNIVVPIASGNNYSNDPDAGLKGKAIEAGKYYFTIEGTMPYDPDMAKEFIIVKLLVRDPLPGESFDNPYVLDLTEFPATVDYLQCTGESEFWIKMNLFPGDLTIKGTKSYNAFLLSADDLEKVLAELSTKTDDNGTWYYGIFDYQIEEPGVYYYWINYASQPGTLTFSGSAFGKFPTTIPEEYNVTVNQKDVEVMQEMQEIDEGLEMLTISVTGTSYEENFTVSFNDLPDGWDGVMLIEGATPGTYNIGDWPTMDEVESEYEDAKILKGTEFTFTAPTRMKTYLGYLYSGDKVDEDNPFMFGVMVDYMATPEFPAKFNVAVNQKKVEVTQGIDEDNGAYSINIEGDSNEEEFTVSFNDLPEDWDGVMLVEIGTSVANIGDWPTMDVFEGEYEGDEILKGTEFTFKADAIPHIYTAALYAYDRVDVENMFMVFVNVDFVRSEVNVNVEVEDGASFGFILPVDFTTPLNLNLPENFVVETAELNGEEIEVTDSYEVTTAQEDLNYVFTVAYDGDLEFVDSTTGLVDLDTRVKIGVVDGKIRIEGTEVGDAVAVYTVGGMTVGTYVAQNTALEIALPAGTYIVRVNNNAAKVML